MNNSRASTALPSIWIFALISLLTLFAITAIRCAAQQSVWTDESTQLSGLSLGFSAQIRWLTGHLPLAFAVPPDRTPPLSYWLGSLWAEAFGNSVLTMRYLGVSLSVASVAALWVAARQYLERGAAFLCATLLAVSPNFIFLTVEIRAYSAFILYSTLLIYAYLRLIAARPTPSGIDLWLFAITAVLCSYTHFFGIVISAGAFVSLLASYRAINLRREGLQIARKAKWPVIFYLGSFIGLVPFILSALKNSGGDDVSTAALTPPLSARVYDLIRLIYRLFSHQSMLGVKGLSTAALLAGLALIVFATIPGANYRGRPVLLYLLVNLSLVALISVATSSFSALAPTYNVWALPVVSLLAATARTHGNRYIRIASIPCLSVLIAADCYGAMRLATAGDIYDHTRSSVVKMAVDTASLNNVIVLYANDAPSIYFAMIYDYGGRLRQYIDRGSTIQMIGTPTGSTLQKICDLNAGTLLVVHDEQLSAESLQFMLDHPATHTQAYYSLNRYIETHRSELASKWVLISKNEYLAQNALVLAVFKGSGTEVSSNSKNCTGH